MVLAMAHVGMLVVSGLTFVLGGAAGIMLTRTIYGVEGGQVSPAPPPVVAACPPPSCAPCPVCQEPTETAVVPPPITETATLAAPGPKPLDLGPAKAGLPAQAISLASGAVTGQLGPCLNTPNANGTLVLELTVTATGGQGFIREVLIGRRTGNVAPVEDCVLVGAKRARFDWAGADGELKFKLPVRVGI